MTKMTVTPAPFSRDFPVTFETGGSGDGLKMYFEGPIPHWGALMSYQLTILRDGELAKTIRFYDMGVKKNHKGELTLKFQMTDTMPGTGAKHAYSLQGNFQFLPLEIIETTPIDWPPVP